MLQLLPWLVASLLPLVALGWPVVEATGRWSLTAPGQALVLIFPLLLLVIGWRGQTGRLASAWIFCGAAGVAWLAGLQATVGVTPLGWWTLGVAAAGVAAGAAAARMVAGDGERARVALIAAGLGAGVTVLLALGMDGARGVLNGRTATCWGIGNSNLLANSAGPAILGALLAAWLPGTARTQWGWRLATALALAALVTYAIATGRRGLFLATVVAGLAALVAWSPALGRRGRALAVAATLAIGITALVFILPRIDPLRNLAWRAAAAVALAEPFPGHGPLAGLAMQDHPAEAARTATASGEWLDHVHSWPLEVALGSGVVGVLLLLARAGLMVCIIAGCADNRLRTAAAATAAAVATLAAIDPTIGMPVGAVWSGLLLGLIAGCDQSSRLAGSGWATIPVALVGGAAAFGSAVTVPMAAQADAPTVAATSARAWNLEESIKLIERLPDLPHGAQAADQVAVILGPRLVWTGPLARRAVAAARADGDQEALLTALVRLQTRLPFDAGRLGDLGALLARQPGLPVPRVLAERALWFHAGQTPIDLPAEPQTIEEAADRFAALVLATQRGFTRADSIAALALVRGWGTSSGVAALGWWLAAEGVLDAKIVRDLPGVKWGLRDSGQRNAVLQAISTPDQARRILPLATLPGGDPALVARLRSLAESQSAP